MTDHDFWFLEPGDEIVATEPLGGASIPAGTVGVVYVGADGVRAAEVRWATGHVTLAPDSAEKAPPGPRPTAVDLIETFLLDDPDLEGSTCNCCAGKRVLLLAARASYPHLFKAR